MIKDRLVTFLQMAVCIGIGALLAWAHSDNLAEQCQTFAAEEQAGYRIVLATQRVSFEEQLRVSEQRKLAMEVRAIHSLAALKSLQQEFGALVGARVVIPEPKAILVSQLEPIEQLAARMAPVEAAVKEVAKQEGGFIPSALRGPLGEILARGLGRGK